MNRHKSLLFSAIISGVCIFAISGAQAEKFTFNSTSETITEVGVTAPSGAMVGGATVKGVSTTVSEDGTTATSNFTCLSSSRPPHETFRTNGVCNSDDGSGNAFGIIFGCNPANADNTENDCWGRLIGASGTYKDRSGSITWHGKEDSSSGTGQWSD